MDQMGFQMPPMGPPQLTRQPPQFFGPYHPQDQAPLQQLPPDFVAHMFSDHMLMDEPEGSETKKRRIARACDMCRKKKIKCDGKLPACTHCLNYKTNCVFTHIEKKRAPPKGAKYIEGLENRLGRMENLLRLSGLLKEDESDLGALESRLLKKSRKASFLQASDSPTPSRDFNSPAHDSHSSPSNSLASHGTDRERDHEGENGRHRGRGKEHQNLAERHGNFRSAASRSSAPHGEVEALADMMCSLVTNQSGESRFTGSSSGFSIFSPKGIQWINSKTGDDSFRLMISHVSEDDHKWTNWKPQVFGHLFQRPIFRPLPPKEEALSLLSDYFINFNCMIPLFYEPTFMHLVDRQYSIDPYPSTGWWASLNVALALAHRLRVVSGLVPAEDDEKGWDYLKNAMACFSELTMRSTDLLSVQALVGMSLFLQGTPNPQPAYMLIASALRLAHSIGLHKKGTGFNLNPIEIEQRKRVFWIANILDKDWSLRSGQPPVQDHDDMSVEFPDFVNNEVGFIPLAEGKGRMCLFKVLCEFAIIQSDVYQRMYSAKASRQSDGELLNTIGELDRQLEEWKDSIPSDFRPEHPIKASHTPLIIHVVMLHFSYYNVLITIHRMSVQHGMWTSRLADYAAKGLNVRPLNPRVFSSAALCTSAARASIKLLKYIPQGDFSCVWMILYFPVSALVTLFANILQNPLDHEARSDVKLMNLVVTFLSMLGHEAEQGGVHRMLGVCSEFCRVADFVIEKAEGDHPSRRKRKNPDAQVSLKPRPTSPQPRPPEQHLSPASAWASPYAAISASLAGSSSQAGSSPSIESMTFTHDHRAQSHETDLLGHFGMAMDGGDGGGRIGASGSLQPENLYGTSGFPQQPLVPPDLFALQMSLDWNWAEMSGGAYPSVENGSFDFSDPSLLHGSPRHQGH